MQRKDLTGLRFGKLVVINHDDAFNDGKHQKWICKCDCGTVKSVYQDSLIQGRTHSCGCQMNKGKKGINSTHGMSQTRLYHEWCSMRRRCLPDSPDAKQYYLRGVTVCSEWQSDFLPFYKWAMDNGYNDSLSIDRINNDEGYSPDNCRWILIEDQQGNKSNTVYVNYNGKDYCLRTLCTKIGFPYKTAHRRLRRAKARGEVISVEKLFAPIDSSKIGFKYRK